ncbi:MAG: DUF5667 domain-containing protein, partial [Candidatus Uhrbacteria bacterium]|nr:DUF5667 domain-containing protein [Candidatus Uhrbacteria bacterium]
MPIIGIVIAIIVVLGGGTSLVAQTSLPGDALYPVKINVNEEAQAFLQTSIEAKARWEVERAERRLEEAEELTVKSTVTVDARMRIEKNFSQQAERVK